MKHFVYILQSLKDGTFYTGSSHDIEQRLLRHNRGETKSIRHKTPFVVIYSEVHATRIEARRRERFLKSHEGRHERESLYHEFGRPVDNSASSSG